MGKDYGKLAQRYAKALFSAATSELAQGEGLPTQEQRLAQQLNELAGLWISDREFSGSILNPMFESEERLNALLEIGRILDIPEVGLRGLRIIFERDRIAALPEIAQAFSDLADKKAGVLRVEVDVARSIEDAEKQSIEDRLRASISGSLEFQWRVDPELLGGILVRYQGKVLDGSLRGRLERIEQRMSA